MHENHLQLRSNGFAQGQKYRFALKGRRKHKEKKIRDNNRVLSESTDQRDPPVDECVTFGDWELDTVDEKKATDAVLLAADERKK